MNHTHKVLLAALILSLPAAAQGDEHSLTIYSSNQPGAIDPSQYQNGDVPGSAVVRTRRELDIARGRSEIRFTDVAAGIDPTTVSFKSISDPDGTMVWEQNYQFDLVNTQKILAKYLGETIVVEQSLGQQLQSYRGTLLAADNSAVVLRTDDDQIVSLRHYTNVRFPELPGGLIVRPTLVWLVHSKRGARQLSEVAYETRGMTWWADYNLVYEDHDEAGCRLDVSAWVSILNRSGGSFPDARLKLIAGEVNRAPRQHQPRPVGYAMRTMEAEALPDGFEQKSFFEYHLYTLGRRTDLPDRSTKQIQLFDPVNRVACRKHTLLVLGDPGFRYGSAPYSDPYAVSHKGNAAVFLEFENRQELGMGMPLPAGRVRVSQRDPDDDSLELIGEDLIAHTPRNERISLRLGNAFDVVGERSQVDFQVDSDKHWIRESFAIEVRNQKAEAATVRLREPLFRWSNWRIETASHEYRKLNSSTIEFELDLDAESEQTVRYTVYYSW